MVHVLILTAGNRSDGSGAMGAGRRRSSPEQSSRGGASPKLAQIGRSGAQIDHILALGDLRDMSKPPGLKPRRSEVLNAGRDYGGDPTRRSSPAMVFQPLERSTGL